MATGESLHSLIYAFRISDCYISVIVTEVVSAICRKLLHILIPMRSENAWRANAIEFWERWQFPNSVWAVNGKDVRIPGSDKVVPFVIVGDEAFRLHRNLMNLLIRDKPRRALKRQSTRARRVSENAFDLLTQIFRIFHSPIAVTPQTCDMLILAACCLHNLIREDSPANLPGNNATQPTARLTNMTPLYRTGRFAHAAGINVRNTLKDYFINEGRVEWQDKVISTN
ncbi:hypothetical protein PR048_021324 [Dryococelus australis]|uniref:DDE Tnp4 domain-containing protein n=1 Tax=Dryococelus australis TaxID=614101 RepID=A0ABQ9GY21_9NEOP|nr:hypothetical protein PR048_021324 [Dryococelus australis]